LCTETGSVFFALLSPLALYLKMHAFFLFSIHSLLRKEVK
jgi:hypothetical protein